MYGTPVEQHIRPLSPQLLLLLFARTFLPRFSEETLPHYDSPFIVNRIPFEGGTANDFSGLYARFVVVTYVSAPVTCFLRRFTSRIIRCRVYFPSPCGIGRNIDMFNVKDVRS